MLIFPKNGIFMVGFTVILMLTVYMGYVEAEATIRLQLTEYVNFSFKKASGRQCEYTSMAREMCKLYFVVCISDNIMRQNCTSDSIKRVIETEEQNGYELDFTWEKTAIKTFLFTTASFNELTGVTFSIYNTANEEIVDLITEMSSQFMVESLPVRPSVDVFSAVTHVRTINNKNGDTSLSFRFVVFCNEFYYGPECTTFCKDMNSESGHYSCTPLGEKKCRNGWTNPETNCLVPYSACAPFPCTITNTTAHIRLDTNTSYKDLLRILFSTKEKTYKEYIRQLLKTKMQHGT